MGAFGKSFKAKSGRWPPRGTAHAPAIGTARTHLSDVPDIVRRSRANPGTGTAAAAIREREAVAPDGIDDRDFQNFSGTSAAHETLNTTCKLKDVS